MALRSVSSQSSVGRGKGRDGWAVALKVPIKDEEDRRQSDHTGPGAAQNRVTTQGQALHRTVTTQGQALHRTVTTQDQALHTVEYTQRRMCVCPRGCVGRLGRRGAHRTLASRSCV